MSISIALIEAPQHTVVRVEGLLEHPRDVAGIPDAFQRVPENRPVLLELTDLHTSGRRTLRRLRQIISIERRRRSIAVSSTDLDARIAIERAGLRGAFPPIAV